jgi:hypothetical protein
MAELRKALKAGSTGGPLAMARRWVAAWRGRAARTGKAAALGPLKDEEGVTPPPRWAMWAAWLMAEFSFMHVYVGKKLSLQKVGVTLSPSDRWTN